MCFCSYIISFIARPFLFIVCEVIRFFMLLFLLLILLFCLSLFVVLLFHDFVNFFRLWMSRRWPWRWERLRCRLWRGDGPGPRFRGFRIHSFVVLFLVSSFPSSLTFPFFSVSDRSTWLCFRFGCFPRDC